MKITSFYMALMISMPFFFKDVQAQDVVDSNQDAVVSDADRKDNWHWTVDHTSSALTFSGRQTGQAFSGEFKDFTADITLNPADLSDARIVIKVQTQSAKTGDQQRDAAMPGTDWFDTKEHPLAVFTSQNIVQQADGRYVAYGDLSIRGMTKNIQLPFDLSIADDRAQAEGTLSLIRTDYGVGRGEFLTGQWVDLEVSVTYRIEAVR